MSMTKREFDNHFSEAEMEHHDLMWQGYDEYLYQQYGYNDYIEDMYEFFNTEECNKPKTLPDASTELIERRNEDNGSKTTLDIIWTLIERLGKGVHNDKTD